MQVACIPVLVRFSVTGFVNTLTLIGEAFTPALIASRMMDRKWLTACPLG